MGLKSRAALILWMLISCLFLSLIVEAQTETSQPYVLTVQPIVVRGDDGLEPASMAIPEALVDRAYLKAGLDFYFLEPLYYDNTAARDGLVNLDEIVKSAKAAGVMRGHGNIVNMFFVNAVDGNKGPLGRGMLGGDITFIALDRNSTLANVRDQEAFVIAHEVGHNLGLNHAVDDENVPNDIPNIQGDGPFADRIDPRFSLNAYQVELLRKSPLVRPRIETLSVKDGRQAILDESFEPFFSILQKKEVEAFIGARVESEDVEEIRDIARRKFSSAVLPFSIDEARQLSELTQETIKVLSGGGFGSVANHPWRFLKVAPWLCGGFAFTRGNTIVLSQKHINTLLSEKSLSKRLQVSGALIVHEQIHSLQRSFPSKFEKLNTEYWGFVKANVESTGSLVKNQLSNPDAPLAQWLIPSESAGQYYWVRTVFRNVPGLPQMGKDFVERVYSVQETQGQFDLILDQTGKPVQFSLSAFGEYANSFPVTRGIDHPNEIAAYMFAEVFRAQLGGNKGVYFANLSEAQKNNSEEFVQWLKMEM